jgi:hypothetical protein
VGEWFANIKLGAGFVGKATTVLVAYLTVCFADVVTMEGLHKLWGIAAAVIGLVLYFIATTNWTKTDPILASMDGPDALKYVKAGMGAKNPQVIEGSASPVQNPTLQGRLSGGGQ